MPLTTAATPRPRYRYDLDGLRGIAITLVACFHIWFGRVSGGVDVFLTLSGFFFVASLTKHLIASIDPSVGTWQAVNPWPRLSRLARRLLPALLTVLVAIVVLTVVIMPRTRWDPLGSEVIASALYYQNWHLALNSQDYDSAGSANSPMQHLWSMSVQGQFFVLMIVCSLLLALALKIAATRIPALRDPRVIRALYGAALLAVALMSFYWAHMRHGVNQPWNYYDTFARLWEPLLGGLAALWLPLTSLRSRWVRNVVAAAGLALIVTCGWWIDGVAQYPGPWALVPAGATLLLIWAGATPTDADAPHLSQALAHRAIVWLGGVAYALYLWHWPLLIFYLTWRYHDDVSWYEGAAIIAISLVLAWLTTRYVEAPLRAGGTRRGGLRWPTPVVVGLTTTLTVCSLVAATGITLWHRHIGDEVVNTANLDPRVYPGARALLSDWEVPKAPIQPSTTVAAKDWPIGHYPPNRTIANFGEAQVIVGHYGDRTAQRTIALVGGSHSEYWLTALDDLGRKHHFGVTTYLKVGCSLVTVTVPVWFGKPQPECLTWFHDVMAQLRTAPDVVFTVSTRPNPKKAGDFIPGDYVEVFKEFARRDQRVIAVRDNPWTNLPGGGPPECLASGRSADECGITRQAALSPVDPTTRWAGQFPNTTFLDYSDAMCTDTYCPAVVGNVLVYHDSHHLSSAFVRSLQPYLERDLQKALNWWPAGPDIPRG